MALLCLYNRRKLRANRNGELARVRLRPNRFALSSKKGRTVHRGVSGAVKDRVAEERRRCAP